MEWYVYISDFNARKIKKYNIFNHYGFHNDCIEIAKRGITKEEFQEEIRRSLMYFYWSKCEWEIILSDFPSHKDFREEKVSVYDQIMMDFDKFIDYVWDHRNELR